MQCKENCHMIATKVKNISTYFLLKYSTYFMFHISKKNILKDIKFKR